MRRLIFLGPMALLLAITSPAAEPKYLAPTAQGGAAQCPKHAGPRTLRSEIIRLPGSGEAYIVGTSTRHDRICSSVAALSVRRHGRTQSYKLASAEKHSYSIVDSSPDGSALLLTMSNYIEYPNEDFRNIQVSMMPLSSGEIRLTAISTCAP